MSSSTVGDTTAVTGIKLSEIRDLAGITADVQMLQYDMTRQMTRLLAAKASQNQSRAELMAPLSALKGRLDGYQFPNAGEAFSEELVQGLDDPETLADLDAWLGRNNGFLGATPAEQLEWQSLLASAGYSMVPKFPVFMQSRVVQFDDHANVVSETVNSELVWMDQSQRDTLNATLSPSPSLSYSEQGMEALFTFSSVQQDDFSFVATYTYAYCIDRGAGPHLSQQEFDDLRALAAGDMNALGASLTQGNAHLRVQNENLLKLLDGSTEMIKDLRAIREKSHEVVAEDTQVATEKDELRERWRDRDNARPINSSTGRAPIPGSTRGERFPTSAPPPEAFAADTPGEDEFFRPHQNNV